MLNIGSFRSCFGFPVFPPLTPQLHAWVFRPAVGASPGLQVHRLDAVSRRPAGAPGMADGPDCALRRDGRGRRASAVALRVGRELAADVRVRSSDGRINRVLRPDLDRQRRLRPRTRVARPDPGSWETKFTHIYQILYMPFLCKLLWVILWFQHPAMRGVLGCYRPELGERGGVPGVVSDMLGEGGVFCCRSQATGVISTLDEGSGANTNGNGGMCWNFHVCNMCAAHSFPFTSWNVSSRIGWRCGVGASLGKSSFNIHLYKLFCSCFCGLRCLRVNHNKRRAPKHICEWESNYQR